MMLQLRRGHVNNSKIVMLVCVSISLMRNPDMVSAIASILATDPTVVTAHLCHEATQHISKTAIEGKTVYHSILKRIRYVEADLSFFWQRHFVAIEISK